MTGRSEKLAQEGLCGDRDRLAVGKRVGFGVRDVAHDLKGVCGTGSLLLIGRYGKNTAAMQYQTDRWVRIVNTKLTDGSEWHLERNPVGACVPHARRGALLLGLSYENVQYVTLLFCAESGSCEQPARENKEARL